MKRISVCNLTNLTGSIVETRDQDGSLETTGEKRKKKNRNSPPRTVSIYSIELGFPDSLSFVSIRSSRKRVLVSGRSKGLQKIVRCLPRPGVPRIMRLVYSGAAAFLFVINEML